MRTEKCLLPIVLAFIITSILIGTLAQWGQTQAASTATITVCAAGCNHTSIQEAVDAANDGDTIHLAAEIYTETITLNKSIDIIGEGAGQTILQAAGARNAASSRVITVTAGISTTIQGVTIRYGYPHNQPGGGIYNLGTLTLTESTISNNSAYGAGGGIYNQGHLFIFDALIQNNEASMAPGGGVYNSADGLVFDHVTIAGNRASARGGGMFCSGANIVLSNITFAHNSTGDYGGGGGLVIDNSNPKITNAVFRSNAADFADGGGGMLVIKSKPTLTNTVFRRNSAKYTQGGGIYNIDSQPKLINVSISGNTTDGSGGGIYNYNSDITITNSIIWGNFSIAITGTAATAIFNEDSTPVIRHTLVQGSGGSDNWDTALGADGGNNLDADPLFVGASDLHLQSGSPSINAGTNPSCPSTDLDGRSRPIGSFCDLGAYEYGYLIYLPLVVR